MLRAINNDQFGMFVIYMGIAECKVYMTDHKDQSLLVYETNKSKDYEIWAKH